MDWNVEIVSHTTRQSSFHESKAARILFDRSPFAFQLPRPFNMPTEPRDISLGIDSGTTAAKPGGVFANGEPVSVSSVKA